MITNLNTKINNISVLGIWGIFFIYSVLISLVIQLIILPYLGPEYHHGDGQLMGGDWGLYQSLAVQESNKINQFGWSVWKLKSQDSMHMSLIGVISAIYSFFGTQKPYILIPLFSTFHSIGAVCILMIIEKLSLTRNIAFFSALPYLIFPSSLLWVTQILKDVFSLNGSLMALYGLIILFGLVKAQPLKVQFKEYVSSLIFIFCGLITVWIAREYMVSILLIFILFIFLILNIFLITSIVKRKITILPSLSLIIFQFFVISLINNLPNSNFTDIQIGGFPPSIVNYSDSQATELERLAYQTDYEEYEAKILETQAEQVSYLNQTSIQEELVESVKVPQVNSEKFDLLKQRKHWEESIFLPNIIDLQFKKIYLNRTYFHQYNFTSNSAVDYELDINSFLSMIKYLPRATQIAFLAPFPSSWLSTYPSSKSGLMYKISGLEMLFIYVSLVGTICALYIWRKKIEIWVMLSFSLYFGLVYTFAFPNVGALIRYRYAALMLLVAIGLAAFAYIYSNKKYTKNE